MATLEDIDIPVSAESVSDQLYDLYQARSTTSGCQCTRNFSVELLVSLLLSSSLPSSLNPSTRRSFASGLNRNIARQPPSGCSASVHR
jgi:hypothetical protein